MFEESVATIPSIWASMNSWFTPTVLFVLLNVVIGTIALTSTLTNQNKHHHNQQQQEDQSQNNLQQQQQPNKLAKSPSLLQRVRSINFYSSRSQEPPLNLTTSTTSTIKLPPDSNTLYNFEHTHQLQTLENPSHYIFEQPHLDYQPNDTHMKYNLFHENPQETNTLYNVEYTHQLEKLETPTPYIFEQPHQDNQANDAHMEYNLFQENAQEANAQYFFEQTHEVKAQETATHQSFEHKNQEKFEAEASEDEEEEDGELRSLEEVYSKLRGGNVSRTMSDTEPASGEVPARLPTKMRKSASLKSAFGHFEEEDIVETRRPATVRERGAKVAEADDEVDAKADDFINKFKNQLKLQRLDSIIRYKDMVNRGSGK